ncbi:hypothetical protein BT96DRAFT_1011235 [Gymnopus androsaceus JB14]|uniref:DUF6533 domain-containing protein n=1 Tax=Gymnopus androsaceus JB14 TaxID=1447944 RepID=A0A6A4IUK1_9AGAR|nr:hypothetical protein BT96DRAFT_1011235 [Gymnopus androsaceus JB14]
MPLNANRLIRDLESSSGSAFFFLAWEILITLDDEVELIWSKPWNSWIKWAFLVGRYFSLLLLFADQVVRLVITYSTINLHDNVLRIWFALQGLIAFSIMEGAEICLMARIYALYNKNKWVGYGFMVLLSAEALTAFLGIGLTFPRPPFDPQVIITQTPGSFDYFSIATLVSQTILLALSMARYRFLYKQGYWGGTRILHLMSRDGTLAFAIFFMLSLLMLIYHVLHEPFAPDEYTWSIGLISTTECRLILNLQKLPIAEPDFTSFPELTTILTNDRSGLGTSHMMTVFREEHVPHEEHEIEC